MTATVGNDGSSHEILCGEACPEVQTEGDALQFSRTPSALSEIRAGEGRNGSGCLIQISAALPIRASIELFPAMPLRDIGIGLRKILLLPSHCLDCHSACSSATQPASPISRHSSPRDTVLLCGVLKKVLCLHSKHYHETLLGLSCGAFNVQDLNICLWLLSVR